MSNFILGSDLVDAANKAASALHDFDRGIREPENRAFDIGRLQSLLHKLAETTGDDLSECVTAYQEETAQAEAGFRRDIAAIRTLHSQFPLHDLQRRG